MNLKTLFLLINTFISCSLAQNSSALPEFKIDNILKESWIIILVSIITSVFVLLSILLITIKLKRNIKIGKQENQDRTKPIVKRFIPNKINKNILVSETLSNITDRTKPIIKKFIPKKP